MSSESSHSNTSAQSPFFRAIHSHRYERQESIRNYENYSDRSLIIFWGPITEKAITPFADAINDVQRDYPLDIMLTSYGGDGEAAIRIATMCRSTKRSNFRVIVPDMAASAATLLTLAADSVLMSDTSTLGPIDPQIYLPTRREYMAAKDIVRIVDEVIAPRINENPQLSEFYTSFLMDIDAVTYQKAHAAIERSEEFGSEVLGLRQQPPSAEESQNIFENLHNQTMHSATIGHAKAAKLGIPVKYLEPQSEMWDLLWRIHALYAATYGPSFHINVIEGRRVSFVFSFNESNMAESKVSQTP